MIIKCKNCDTTITIELSQLASIKSLNVNDGEDFIPRGYYFISDGEFFSDTIGKIIINRKDLINSKYHPDLKRLKGCCGYDGLDGLNKTCMNAHEIGTEFSDCWMPHCIILENDLIKIVI
jgi:hypothetical protein